MYAGKRPAYAAVSGKKKQAKQAGSAFADAGNSAHEQHGAARFVTKPSAAAVVSPAHNPKLHLRLLSSQKRSETQ